MPLQVADLRRPQTVAKGDQDHRRVAMPIAAILASSVYQPLDLALGEITPFDCQVYNAWGAFLGCRFHADKLSLRVSDCKPYSHFLHGQRDFAASEMDEQRRTLDFGWARGHCWRISTPGIQERGRS